MSDLLRVGKGSAASQQPGDVLREFVAMGRTVHTEAREVNDEAHATSWYLRFCAAIGGTLAANIRDYIKDAEGVSRDWVIGSNSRIFRDSDDWYVGRRRWPGDTSDVDFSYAEIRHRSRRGGFTGVSIERGSVHSSWVQSIVRIYDTPTSYADTQIGDYVVKLGQLSDRYAMSPIEGLGEIVNSVESIPGIGKQVFIKADKRERPLFNGKL